MKEEKIRCINLTLTEQCNLSCNYCYESHKSLKTMKWETAKKIIDSEFNSLLHDYQGIEIDLFGGEPFLSFPMIKKITEYVCSKKSDIRYTLFATTNGTLIHNEIQTWLKDHKNCFVCGLSLDGTRKMHNQNRSNSYDEIDLDFFLSTYPEQDVKMTISAETLPELASGVIDLQTKGFKVSCNLAYGIDWSNTKNESILERELMKLIAFYLDNPKVEPCSILNQSLTNVGANIKEAIRYCGAGIEMCAYDVDGDSYPCQFFMPLSLGVQKAHDSKNLVFPESIIPEMLLDKKCKNCIIRSACPNCYGSNYMLTGNIFSRDDNMCRLTKVIFKACSYFYAQKWKMGLLSDMNDIDLNTLLNAIVAVQEKL